MILAFPNVSLLEILPILSLPSLRNTFNGSDPISPNLSPATSPFDLDSLCVEHVDDEIDLRCEDSMRFFGGDSTWFSAAGGSLNARLDMIGTPAVGESAASFWNRDLRGSDGLGGSIAPVGSG